jgi:hypothetical protein
MQGIDGVSASISRPRRGGGGRKREPRHVAARFQGKASVKLLPRNRNCHVSIRQHAPAYVSIRQHTSASVK